MSTSDPAKETQGPDEEPRIDTWPATTATEPATIIRRVEKVIEARHDRGEAQDTSTVDVVQDLEQQDVPHLLEKASGWIAVVGVEATGAESGDTRNAADATDAEVHPRDALRCEDVRHFDDAGGRWEEVTFEPFGGTEPISLRLPSGDPASGRYRKGEVYDVHEIGKKLDEQAGGSSHTG